MVRHKKALFFDRDGTIIRSKISNKNKPIAIKKIEECKIYPSVKRILNKFKKNYLIFLITNQPDVKRKKNSKINVIKINKYLKENLPIKKVYTCYCDSNKCIFRKPNIGMLKKASKKYQLNLAESYVVGDRWKDIEAGRNANCKTIFIDHKYSERLKSKPDYFVKSFFQIDKIIKS